VTAQFGHHFIEMLAMVMLGMCVLGGAFAAAEVPALMVERGQV
jgi:hypothetical protein